MADKVIYTIRLGDEEIDFEGPDGLTDEQIADLGMSVLAQAKPGEKFNAPIVTHPEDAPEAEPAVESSAVGSFLRGLPKEATFNFADEIAAFGNAAIPGLAALDNLTGAAGGEQQAFYDNPEGFWAAVRNNMGDFGTQAEADDEQHPLASATGKIGGVLATIPRAASAVAQRLPQAFIDRLAARPISAAITAGAAGGAVSGAGAGEEGSRAQSAALGGMTGAALGGGVVGALELGPAIANYAKIFFNKASDKEAIQQIVKALHRDGFDVVTPSGIQKLKTALQEFTGKPVSLADIGGATRARAGVGLRAPSDVQQQSIDAVRSRQAGQGQRIAQDIRANVAPRTDVHALDEQLVAQRASEAERLRELALFEEAPKLYRGGAPYDPTHPGPTFFTRDRDAAESYVQMHKERFGTPGEVQETSIAMRNPAPLEVVREEARKVSGLDSANIAMTPASLFDPALHPGGKEAVDELIGRLRQRGFDGTELPDLPYEAMLEPEIPMTAVIPFDHAKQVGAPGRFSRIVEDPELQQLVRLPDAQKALNAALERARSERDLLAATGKSIDHLPDLTNTSDLDVRTLDYLKRFLDDEVNTLYKRGDTATFKAGQAAQVKELRNAIRERLRTAVPEYGDYLDAYKGSSEMIDSLEKGRSFDALDPEQIAAEQADRSIAGQELYRVGAARNLLDTLRNTRDTSNPASRILNSEEARAQLAATGVDPAAAANLNRSISQERTLNLLPQELAGSQTASRAMAQADADAGADMIVPFNPGSPIGWAGMAARTVLNKTSVNRNAKVNEALLPRLLETDPKAVENIIRELEQEGNVAMARSLRRQMQARRGALMGGAIIGAPVALENTGE